MGQARNQHEAARREAICSSKASADFHRLHSIISQKIELFITNAARTPNPTWYDYLEEVADHVLEMTMD
jgi:hypothetical protein